MRERPSAETARTALRKATAAAHERLHHLPAFAALASGNIERADYVSLLKRLLGFHRPVEAAIAASLADTSFGGEMPRWQRAAFLEADLDALDAAGGAVELLPASACTTCLRSAASAMGWLYVLEGSTLGGRILARQLDHILAKHDARGRLFLLNGGDSAHTGWQNFCRAVDACGAEPGRRAAMIASAADAFSCFEAWFSGGQGVTADFKTVRDSKDRHLPLR